MNSIQLIALENFHQKPSSFPAEKATFLANKPKNVRKLTGKLPERKKK
jgi:hypothetical protein